MSLRVDPANSTRIQALVGADVRYTFPQAQLPRILFFGMDGNDRIYVDNSFGSVNADLIAFGGNGSDTLDGSSAGDTLEGGGGVDSISGFDGDDAIDVNSGTFTQPTTVDGGNGFDTVNVGTPQGSLAVALLSTRQDLAALRIFNGATASVAIGGDKTIFTRSLQIDGTGVLDLADEDLIVDYATGNDPYDVLKGRLASGYAGSAWDGQGINSSTAAANPTNSTALGYAQASVILGPGGGSFSSFSVDGTAVLIKYTYYGDADLNGQVDVNDLGILASNWQMPGDWVRGDFDYNGSIDVNDLGLLATNWQAGVGSPLGPGQSGGEDGDVDGFLAGIEKLALSEDEIAKLLELLNSSWKPGL
jgi:hypothetical protein